MVRVRSGRVATTREPQPDRRLGRQCAVEGLHPRTELTLEVRGVGQSAPVVADVHHQFGFRAGPGHTDPAESGLRGQRQDGAPHHRAAPCATSPGTGAAVDRWLDEIQFEVPVPEQSAEFAAQTAKAVTTDSSANSRCVSTVVRNRMSAPDAASRAAARARVSSRVAGPQRRQQRLERRGMHLGEFGDGAGAFGRSGADSARYAGLAPCTCNWMPVATMPNIDRTDSSGAVRDSVPDGTITSRVSVRSRIAYTSRGRPAISARPRNVRP